MYNYVVMFTYSFDNDSAAYLFPDLERAVSFLKANYEEQLRIDIEENEWETISELRPDGMYAKITNIFCEHKDVTEMHIAPIYQ